MSIVYRGVAVAWGAAAAILCASGYGADSGRKESLSLDLGGGTTLEFVRIRPGSFTMGDDHGFSDEPPAHTVTITKPFYLGEYEVTQQQWQAVMGGNPSRFRGPQSPVENVSWKDCQTYLKRLTEKFAATGEKFSLPTEAQWEYACRAGSTTKYGFGDDEAALPAYAWFKANAGNTTHTVGQKKPNAWGLYDMHGNVWQWCADWYDAEYYKRSPAVDPTGPAAGVYRVVRGGGWDAAAAQCRSANRLLYAPAARHAGIGFRVVCER